MEWSPTLWLTKGVFVWWLVASREALQPDKQSIFLTARALKVSHERGIDRLLPPDSIVYGPSIRVSLRRVRVQILLRGSGKGEGILFGT